MTRQDEQRLIQKAAAGDRAAAEKLIRQHQRPLYAYLLRMSGRPELAEDITQEAFVRALTNLDRFDLRYRFSTWLYTIARRLYLNACQRLKPVYDTDTVAAVGSSVRGRVDQPEPSEAVARSDTAAHASAALNRALARLSAEQREIIVLFHQLDWSIALIAQHLDMPAGTVKSHLHRGRRRLRELLKRERQAIAETRLEPAASRSADAYSGGSIA